MKETNLIAAILTVAFYTGRGGALGLPQIVATYHEMLDLLTAEAPREPARGAKKQEML